MEVNGACMLWHVKTTISYSGSCNHSVCVCSSLLVSLVRIGLDLVQSGKLKTTKNFRGRWFGKLISVWASGSPRKRLITDFKLLMCFLVGIRLFALRNIFFSGEQQISASMERSVTIVVLMTAYCALYRVSDKVRKKTLWSKFKNFFLVNGVQ